jgi:hypothetical protein
MNRPSNGREAGSRNRAPGGVEADGEWLGAGGWDGRERASRGWAPNSE